MVKLVYWLVCLPRPYLEIIHPPLLQPKWLKFSFIFKNLWNLESVSSDIIFKLHFFSIMIKKSHFILAIIAFFFLIFHCLSATIPNGVCF